MPFLVTLGGSLSRVRCTLYMVRERNKKREKEEKTVFVAHWSTFLHYTMGSFFLPWVIAGDLLFNLLTDHTTLSTFTATSQLYQSLVEALWVRAALKGTKLLEGIRQCTLREILRGIPRPPCVSLNHHYKEGNRKPVHGTMELVAFPAWYLHIPI